MVKIGINEMKI